MTAGESVEVMVARLEGTINTNFAIIRADAATQRDQLHDHEARVRVLEANSPTRTELDNLEGMLSELNRWRWKLIGFFSAVTALVGVGAAIITTLIEQAITTHN